jgi:hypothetical protein
MPYLWKGGSGSKIESRQLDVELHVAFYFSKTWNWYFKFSEKSEKI